MRAQSKGNTKQGLHRAVMCRRDVTAVAERAMAVFRLQGWATAYRN